MPLPQDGYTATGVEYDLVVTEGSNAAVVKVSAEAGAGISEWQDRLGVAVAAFRQALTAPGTEVSGVRTTHGAIQELV